MSPPAASVLMPVRNEQRYIGRALRSLRRQTIRAIEIVVVDDGSTDRTAALVARHAAADPRVRLVTSPGQGFTAALNHGLGLCRSPLVARMDADDVALSRRLERQLAELAANPAAVAVGTYGLRINELGLPIGRLRVGPAGRDGYRAAMAGGGPIILNHPSAVFRREAVEHVGGYRAEYYPSDDFKLWTQLAELGEVYAVPRLLMLYRIRGAGISAEGTLAQEMQNARIETEFALGREFASVDDFRSHLHAHEPDAALLQRRWEAMAVQRRLSRALANGRLLTAARVVREGGVDTRTFRGMVRRAVRG